jgi:hypothetical protein
MGPFIQAIFREAKRVKNEHAARDERAAIQLLWQIKFVRWPGRQTLTTDRRLDELPDIASVPDRRGEAPPREGLMRFLDEGGIGHFHGVKGFGHRYARGIDDELDKVRGVPSERAVWRRPDYGRRMNGEGRIDDPASGLSGCGHDLKFKKSGRVGARRHTHLLARGF